MDSETYAILPDGQFVPFRDEDATPAAGAGVADGKTRESLGRILWRFKGFLRRLRFPRFRG